MFRCAECKAVYDDVHLAFTCHDITPENVTAEEYTALREANAAALKILRQELALSEREPGVVMTRSLFTMRRLLATLKKMTGRSC